MNAKYAVYLHTNGERDSGFDGKEFLGETIAVSPQKAINNVRFRTGTKPISNEYFYQWLDAELVEEYDNPTQKEEKKMGKKVIGTNNMTLDLHAIETIAKSKGLSMQELAKKIGRHPDYWRDQYKKYRTTATAKTYNAVANVLGVPAERIVLSDGQQEKITVEPAPLNDLDNLIDQAIEEKGDLIKELAEEENKKREESESPENIVRSFVDFVKTGILDIVDQRRIRMAKTIETEEDISGIIVNIKYRSGITEGMLSTLDLIDGFIDVFLNRDREN